MLLIETLKRKIPEFLNSNTCFCSRLYGRPVLKIPAILLKNATFEVFYSCFHGQKYRFFQSFLHCSIRTKKLNSLKVGKTSIYFFGQSRQNIGFLNLLKKNLLMQDWLFRPESQGFANSAFSPNCFTALC